MALYPKIDSPCPVIDSLDDFLEGDLCSLCDRQVHDISAMSDDERQHFLSSCSGEVCVTYSVKRKRGMAAVALSSVLMTLPSAAQDASPVEVDTICPVGTSAHCGDIVLDIVLDEEYEILVTGGGIKDPTQAEYVDTEEDLALPVVPVTYED